MTNDLLKSILDLYFQGNVITIELLIPLTLIILDWLTGVMSAVKHGVFSWSRITDVLGNDVIKYIGAYFLVLFTWLGNGSVAATTLASSTLMGAMTVAVIASIWQNLHEILSPSQLALADQVGADLGMPDPYANPVPQQAQVNALVPPEQVNQYMLQTRQPVASPAPPPVR